MKIIRNTIEKDGTITFMPEDGEDIWHLYNLISKNDSLKGKTHRKVLNDSVSGPSSSSRVWTTLIITVEDVTYYSDTNELRIKGRTLVDNEFVKKQSYHTLTIGVKKVFSLRKAEWDSISLNQLDYMCNPVTTSDIVAVIMQEGLAYICLVKSSMTITRAKIVNSIPRKRTGQIKQRDQALKKFFNTIMNSLFRNVCFDNVKSILIASPGFLKDDFFKHMVEFTVKDQRQLFMENKHKFLLVHSSSGFKHALEEILKEPKMKAQISESVAASEMSLMDKFFSTLNTEPSKAFYGLAHCEKACEAHAIEQLLITDELFRNSVPVVRKQYIRLIDSVREYGGSVRIFSSMHVGGEMLTKITGVAAILRFPMPELEEDEENASDQD